MTTLNIQNMRDEVCHMLRNSDIFGTASVSRTIRGVTNSTYTATSTASQTTITLTNAAVKNIRTFTINSVDYKLFKDYTIVWNTGVITLVTAVSAGLAISVNYDYGSGDKIFPDYPRDDLTLTSYPRVAVELTSMRTEPFGLGGSTHITDVIMSLIVWVPVNIDTSVSSGFGGLSSLSECIRKIRDAVRTNAKLLYICPFITPIGNGPVIRGTNMKLLQQNQDITIKFKVE